MKYHIGQLVRIGGSKGAIAEIVGYDPKSKVYHLDDHEGCQAYLTEDYLKPVVRFEQLKLF